MEITVEIIADSITEDDKRITTFELQYPRFIHSEFMTHRLFSRNAMSSRAVPISKMIDQVRNDPAQPVHWGANQSGMQAENEIHNIEQAKEMWDEAAYNAARYAGYLDDIGLHKQIVNRVLEPFQMMKTVLTATELDNFFWLRCHSDAQPEIKVLADKMYDAMQESTPQRLTIDQWHVPYVEFYNGVYYSSGVEVNLEDALKISASCCAQVSYRMLDDSVEKAIMIYDKLVESKPVHASPFEHQAKPMVTVHDHPSQPMVDEEGVTHRDMDGNYWSGNFKGWIQHRQLIKDNVCNAYDPDADTEM